MGNVELKTSTIYYIYCLDKKYRAIKILLHQYGNWLALDSAVAAAIQHEDWGMCLE